VQALDSQKVFKSISEAVDAAHQKRMPCTLREFLECFQGDIYDSRLPEAEQGQRFFDHKAATRNGSVVLEIKILEIAAKTAWGLDGFNQVGPRMRHNNAQNQPQPTMKSTKK
jgi:hypothetical protein